MKALRTVAGIALALVAAELYVRPLYSMRATYEPGIGYVNAPGPLRWHLEGVATSTWGEHGERLTRGGDGGARVLVLGDSFTEALMIADDEPFPQVAQRRLDAAGVRIDLVNAGRNTMSVADYTAMAPRFRELHRPAWTVVELRSVDLGEDAWTAGRTRFVRDATGKLGVETVITPRRALFERRQASMLAALGITRLQHFKGAAALEPPLFQASRPAAGSAPPPPAPPVAEELELLFAAYDGRVTLLFLSAPEVAQDPVEDAVGSYCEQSKRSCVFTRNEFLALRRRGEDAFGFANTRPGIGHMNAAGHAVAGDVLAAELVRIRERVAARDP